MKQLKIIFLIIKIGRLINPNYMLKIGEKENALNIDTTK